MKLDLVFLWHMHQPDYRNHATGDYELPWVYLHALKDYADMASHLERHPGLRAAVNFVPVLLEQLEDYVTQFDRGEFRDPLLRLLARADMEGLAAEERRHAIDTCFRSNHSNMLRPFAGYRRLHELYLLVAKEGGAAPGYLSGQYFADLVTWYHLAWTAESERRRSPLLAELFGKAEGFSAHDRTRLLAYVGETLRGIVPRYRALAERGQVELTTSPETHPLSPLLLDFAAARESLPASPLPGAACYPGGRSRLQAQIEAACASHERRFGARPEGMWPSEGAVSDAAARMMAGQGIRWIASSESVLKTSLARQGEPLEGAHLRPWTLAGAPELTLFFRDERLSDRIGFEYARWHGRDAAADFVHHLETIAASTPAGEPPRVVSVILDGENAWETYPYNGYFFLDDLYGQLAAHPGVRTVTPAQLRTERDPAQRGVLQRLAAGSWIHGTLATWMGHAAKNRAWDLLCEAKETFDRVASSGRLPAPALALATRQLAACEGSDWFWWPGDDNAAEPTEVFDRLYRINLSNLYRLLGLEPPAKLSEPLGSGAGGGEGAMRRA